MTLKPWAFAIRVPRSSPSTINAVAQASAYMQLVQSTDTDVSPDIEGAPMHGSMVCEKTVPSRSRQWR